MSYRRKVSAIVHDGEGMTVDEFEQTVALWDGECPALAVHIRALQHVERTAKIAADELKGMGEGAALVRRLHELALRDQEQEEKR